MTARRNWAGWYAPHDPAARPRQPINHLTTPILFAEPEDNDT